MCLSLQKSVAQLGFCSGNSGDIIFSETFGAGTNDIALPPGTTTYIYNPSFPIDGQYLVSNNSEFFGWHTNVDHTGDENGRYFTINADDSTNGGEFFTTKINGLCQNTSYEFSAWLLNILPPSPHCPNGGIPINVKFQILDSTDGTVLAEGDTGAIPGTQIPNWEQYGLLFTTKPSETSVILKMLNNGIGGCGNDLAIDDIVFKSCGDLISLTDHFGENILAQCEDEGVILSTTITATPDFSIYSSHAYQWQESADAITWIDIVGETSNTYTTPTLIDSRYFRVKVAEDPINVSNDLCNVISEVFSALIIPIAAAPQSTGDLIVCANEPLPLRVTTPENQVVNWYDAPSGGNLLLAHSNVFTPTSSGTYYAAASSELTDCFSASRTAVTYTMNELPAVYDEQIIMCENVPLFVSAGVSKVSYLWNTGEITSEIEINQPGIYTMTATNQNGCSSVKTIMVDQIDQPIIESIRSTNEDIIVRTVNNGDFEYAIDGGSFQFSPVFEIQRGGKYTISVRGKTNCPAVSQEFLHFVIPKYFSPNGDAINDTFELQGLEFFSDVEVQIFNRYGNLMAQSVSSSFSWDGTFNGTRLPSSDYWYAIRVDGQLFKGHFALRR